MNQDFRDLFKTLNDCGVKSLVVGAYAVVYYAEPRFTKDLDIWVEATPENARRVWKALAAFGAPLENVTEADFANPELMYQVGIAPNRIDIMMSIPGVDFPSAWENRVAASYGEVPISIISLDDLIKAKQAAGREQDQLDLKSLDRAKAPKQGPTT